MNIHPLFVHFPIALLTIYALFEIFIPIKIKAFKFLKKENTIFYKWLIDPVWNSIKAFLVIVGTLISFPTLQTGELAEEIFRDAAASPEVFHQSQVAQLIEVHSTFADITVNIFTALAVAYLIRIVWNSWIIEKFAFVKKLSDFILNPWVASILALAGLIAITITGALGGAIVYGPDVDPVVQIIYNWFF